MSPDQLSRNDTEHGHQAALFAWANHAMKYGFIVANQMQAYTKEGLESLRFKAGSPIPALRWLHAIPNGGKRDAVTAARMKAEGVKPGVADVFLPYPVGDWCGLYLELKKPGKSSTSQDQLDFMAFVIAGGYEYYLVTTWRAGADKIQRYIQYA